MNDFADDSSNVGVGQIMGNKFRLEEKLGQGSFGMIFKCLHLENMEVYAIKMEKRNQRNSSMLVREIKVMMELKNEFGYARMITYGKDNDYNYVVMTNLGKNLDNILKKCGQRFSSATCMNIAEQMITRLEVLHNHNLIHRDIKPENFVIGPDRNFNIVYLIDFGLAKYYKDSEGNHIPVVEKKGMIGTARYASVNAHEGTEQSRRDDLEALGYVLIYFIRGKLPWQQIYAETKEEKYEKIKNMKMNQSLEQICEGCPNEVVQYLRIVKKLEFTEQPNYSQLKALFRKVITDKKLEEKALNVDWETLPEYRHRKKLQNPNDLPRIPTQKEIQMKQLQQKQQQLLQQQQSQTSQQQIQMPSNQKIQQEQILQGQDKQQQIQQMQLTQKQIEQKRIKQKQQQQEQIQQKQQSRDISQKQIEGGEKVIDGNRKHINSINNIQKTIPSLSQLIQDENNPENRDQYADQNKINKKQFSDQKNNQMFSANEEKQTHQQFNQNHSPEPNNQRRESKSNKIQENKIDKLSNQQTIMNKDLSVSVVNYYPGNQHSSQNNQTVQNHNNHGHNRSSSTNLGHNNEKPNSLLHVVNAHNHSNLLNVPSKDMASISVVSLAGTSKLNNYTDSESDTIGDEGGIQMSNMMIDKNASLLTTSDMRKDIKTKSLIIRQSQLDVMELEMSKNQENNSHSPLPNQPQSLNNFQSSDISLLKFDSNHIAIGSQSSASKNKSNLIKNGLNIQTNDNRNVQGNEIKNHSTNNTQTESTNSGQTQKLNNGNKNVQWNQESQQIGRNYHSQNNQQGAQNVKNRYAASSEEIKDHQDEDQYSNKKPIKNYKTQITPITEAKESTYRSLKTKTSKSFIGENVTEAISEYPISINVIPVKKGFMKQN